MTEQCVSCRNSLNVLIRCLRYDKLVTFIMLALSGTNHLCSLCWKIYLTKNSDLSPANLCMLKMKVNKEDDKMRAHAANSAARAAIGGDDVLSKWQLMAEQARQKRDGAVSLSASPRSPEKNQEFGGNGLFTAAKAGKTFFVKHCFFPPSHIIKYILTSHWKICYFTRWENYVGKVELMLSFHINLFCRRTRKNW